MAEDVKKQGWDRPEDARKWHYFGEDRRSLCGRWAMLWGIQPYPKHLIDERQICVACDKKREKVLLARGQALVQSIDTAKG